MYCIQMNLYPSILSYTLLIQHQYRQSKTIRDSQSQYQMFFLSKGFYDNQNVYRKILSLSQWILLHLLTYLLKYQIASHEYSVVKQKDFLSIKHHFHTQFPKYSYFLLIESVQEAKETSLVDS